VTSAPLVASLLAACAVLAAAGAVASAGSASPAIALPAPRGPSATVFPRDRRVELRPWSRLPLVRSRREAMRRAAIDAEVPQLLDLVAASSSAGLSAPLSLRRAAEALRGPLGAELLSAFAAVDLGARWRDELTALAERTGSADLRRTVAALIRTETLGSSLVDATRDLAHDVRRARRAARMERARAAPVKMLFPLVFLVLPAFLLLTVVPVLLTTLRSIG
jgi:tight adherence protein C